MGEGWVGCKIKPIIIILTDHTYEILVTSVITASDVSPHPEDNWGKKHFKNYTTENVLSEISWI